MSREVPTIGVVALAKENHPKDEIYEFVRHLRDRYGTDSSLHLLMDDTVLFDEYAIANRARQLQEEGVDVIVFIVGTWIYSSHLISAVNNLEVPFILYGLSDRIANGNLGASLQIRYVLQEMGKRFPYLCGPMRDEANHDFIRSYARAAWVRRQLWNRKIATIGGKCMMMYQTQVNEFSWKRTFGIDFPQYDAVQVFKEMERVDAAEVERVEKDFLAKVDEVHWEAGEDKMEPDAVHTQVRMYLGFRRMQRLYGIDVFANKCHPEMAAIPYGYGYCACLATCMLNDAGLMTACEADVPAALSMYILHLLTGESVFFADIARLNKGTGRVTFFNCGSAPMSMADRGQGVHIWPMPGNIADEAIPKEYFIGKMHGGTVRCDLKIGETVTVLRIGGNDATLRFHVGRATTCPREVAPDEITANRWPGFGLQFAGDVNRFLQNTTGHHYSLVFGDQTRELEHLASILGIGFVLDT
ncbi:MAG TPA: hypothetical protein VMB46_01565 [Methanomassiliicoccales archaeon]|nr:hypothetical protein [Methanomassiliicoccales archaeon]